MPSSFAPITDTLIFAAANPQTGTELWKSDGTAAGTVLLSDINLGAGSSYPLGMKNVGTLWVFFSASDGAHGQELFWTDGTANNTNMVKDIWPGPNGSSPSGFVDGAVGAGALVRKPFPKTIPPLMSPIDALMNMVNPGSLSPATTSNRLSSDSVFTVPNSQDAAAGSPAEMRIGDEQGLRTRPTSPADGLSHSGGLLLSSIMKEDGMFGVWWLNGV